MDYLREIMKHINLQELFKWGFRIQIKTNSSAANF